jgi:hypothetical protein
MVSLIAQGCRFWSVLAGPQTLRDLGGGHGLAGVAPRIAHIRKNRRGLIVVERLKQVHDAVVLDAVNLDRTAEPLKHDPDATGFVGHQIIRARERREYRGDTQATGYVTHRAMHLKQRRPPIAARRVCRSGVGSTESAEQRGREDEDKREGSHPPWIKELGNGANSNRRPFKQWASHAAESFS